MEIKEGIKAPNFTLIGSDKKEHSLEDYAGKKVVLYFYPKDNTPGCTKEAQCFIDNFDDFNDLNAVILGVSRDSLNSHDKFIDKLNIPFVLLSDEKEEVCNLYEVLKEKNMYGKKSIGIERSTFLIDETGIVFKIYRKVKVDGHIDDILSRLK
ncbi:peroxiredoxin [Clostridium sp. 19966]|uniref:peroxiredoxin n=1 Tax=Clostridium sp. 19966 TaxID=2768166 RepID=UPI0028DDD152|nr:peroxiredoxin [Clostridium sp. 19966]MDT8716821.1 peroxiredoxin [Clostridium sp. 19966]